MIASIVWNVNATIVEDIPFLRWYGICWALGSIVGFYILKIIYQKERQDLKQLDSLATYLLLGGIVGARLGHILFYDLGYYLENPIEILPIKLEPHFQFVGLTGLASHGGVIVALMALILHCKKYNKSFLYLLDRLTIDGAVLGGFIRIGNLFNSEIIGLPTEVPWAFVFVHVDLQPRHPTQLYEAIFYFTVAAALFKLWKVNIQKGENGLLAGLGLTVIFTQRFLVEFLKENQVALKLIFQ